MVFMFPVPYVSDGELSVVMVDFPWTLNVVISVLMVGMAAVSFAAWRSVMEDNPTEMEKILHSLILLPISISFAIIGIMTWF